MSATSTSNLTIQERFEQLQKAKEASSQAPQKAKIQRVAHHLRNRKHFTKHYSPRLVSLGPIHHGDPKLQLGEQYKKMWAAKYIDSTKKSPEELHTKVVQHMETLKPLFEDDLFTKNDTFSRYQEQGFGTEGEMISWMLFVDGCALLQILEYAKLDEPGQMNVKVDQLVLVMQDVLLLENQLPFPLLKLLWRDSEKALMETMKKFLHCHHWATKDEDKIMKVEFPPPTHLLDLQCSIILYDPKKENKTRNAPDENSKGKQTQNAPTQNTDKGKQNVPIEISDKGNQNENVPNEKPCKGTKAQNDSIQEDMNTYRNIKELKAAGIGFKSSKTRRPRDVSFSYGWFNSTLKLPEIVVDDTTAATVLNLMAYEMCPDFQNDYGICSYVSFLDSLIDHPDDVKELRSQKILLNSLGSDEEVANLFNVLSTDLVPDMKKYACVRAQIEKHYRNKCKTWFALGCSTYFSNPWAIIAFHAAVVGLALTFVQTWYAIHPAKP